ncbi:hypothetical protein HTSR_1659 [Halodesulfurarchaeum formicicum]|uniref:Uncharacterized protein n=1 Tax=Halodesulfurarchaeum formicicum TaxID=1873524 RepID=A0A1D8S666_9EURY|nr:hypothetical protein [Halodesulfurarchaeum formicicum]AOW80829.1 hypothetical protein HTSR_1659 [Halodesulfurarchaeum formicicum]
MAETTQTTQRSLFKPEYRAAIATVVAIVVTFGIFIGVTGYHPPVTEWVPSAVGLVGLEVAYSTYNDLWLLVRVLLGAYITFVLLVVALQLVGTWRRLIVDAGGES